MDRNPIADQDMMKLYYSPGSCALASHIALEEAGADYETVRISFGDEEQRSADFLAVNPKGRVPVLVTGRGSLSETPAILLYIAQRHPHADDVARCTAGWPAFRSSCRDQSPALAPAPLD